MFSGLVFDSYFGTGDLAKVELFEKKIGRSLPVSYKNIICKYNGAYVLNRPFFTFYSRLLGQEIESGAGMFLPFGEIDGTSETMEIKREHPPEGLVEGLVIFSSLGNGDFLCFDCREERSIESPKIVIWHHEAVSGSDGEISEVSASFDEFLELLYE